MRVDLDTGKYNVVISSSNFDVSIESGAKLDVNIGKSARIDVNSAVTYIKSGKKEIDTYVEGKVKPDILEYSKVESQKFIDNYVPQTVEDYVDEVTKPSINEYTDTKINQYNQNAVSKTDDFNTLAQSSEETLIQYVDSASLSAKNAKDSADVSTAQASISTAQAVISTTKASESLASANASANSAKQCQAIKDSLGTVYVFKGSVANVSSLPTNAKVGDVYDVQDSGNNYAWTGSSWDSLGVNVDLSNYALKSDLNTKQDKLTAGTGISINNNVISNTQTSAEWGNIKGTLSNQTDLQNALNNKVSKTGNEEFSGLKTMTSTTFRFGNTDLGKYKEIEALAETGSERIGVLRFTNGSDGVSKEAGISIVGEDNKIKGSLLMRISSTGVAQSTTINPPSNSNSSEIATTQWVRNTIKAESPAGRNVGDIFYTSRTDTELNGSVECNGGTYSTSDFTGSQSIGNLLSGGKVPYVSLSEYASIVSSKGSCRAFGWDGGTSFRVPLLKDVYIECGTASSAGEFISESLPNIKATWGEQGAGYWNNNLHEATGAVTVSQGKWSGATSHSVGNQNAIWNFSASRSSSVYKDNAKVKPDSVRYRAMVQLAIKTTDEAVITATSALQQISNKANIDLSNLSTEGINFIKSFFVGGSNNNGSYIKLPIAGFTDKLIIQKGTTSVTKSGVAVTFPTPFKYNTAAVVGNTRSGKFDNYGMCCYNVTTTGFTIYKSGDTATASWIAIGF